jgi:hypothetical protein
MKIIVIYSLLILWFKRANCEQQLSSLWYNFLSYIICHPETSVQTVQSFTFTHRAIVQPPKSNYFRNKHKNTHDLRFNVSHCEYCTSSRHNDRRDQPKFSLSQHHRSPAIDYWQTSTHLVTTSPFAPTRFQGAHATQWRKWSKKEALV